VEGGAAARGDSVNKWRALTVSKGHDVTVKASAFVFTFPVVVGQGARLFPDTGPDLALKLVGSQAVTPPPAE
jgi:hypothetical protein